MGASARRFDVQTSGEADLVGGQVQQLFGGSSHQALAGTIDQLDLSLGVEREDSDVDLGHHAPQQGGGLAGVEALATDGRRQRVGLEHDLAERIVGGGAPGADRRVSLAETGEQVRQGLKRVHDAAADGDREAQPAEAQRERDGPQNLRRVASGPQEHQRHGERWRAGCERHQQHASIVREPGATRRSRAHRP